MAKEFGSAEVIETKDGRQYHIGLAPGDVAPYILLCGDIDRVEKVADLFEEANEPISNREYVTITGKYKGLSLSVLATGMGTDNTEIAVVELSQVVKNPVFIRVGSCSAVNSNISIGDLVISSGAVRLENTSTSFVTEGYPSFAHHEVILALLEAANKNNKTYHFGLTATASGFYGAQGRNTSLFKTRNPKLIEELDRMNVSNIEMEASTLFTLSTIAGFRAGAVCAVYGQRLEDKFIDPDLKKTVEMNAIKTALDAIGILARMDKLKGSNNYWLPSMGT